MGNDVTILATGDVVPDRPRPELLFELAAPTLKTNRVAKAIAAVYDLDRMEDITQLTRLLATQ
ncbi:MAG: hypothetical protein HYX90_06840 [Chloroflexi bacterium]|nr:hypothetical protein [Chloroflexota bacterium]